MTPTRREILLAASAFLAGCTGDYASPYGDDDGATPTPEPTATPEPTPTYPDAVVQALEGESRFSKMACPGSVPCLHRLSASDDLPGVAVPEDELVAGADGETTVTTYNLLEDPVVLDVEPLLYKWSGITWVPVVPVHRRREVTTVDAGGTLSRTVSTDVGGDGTYAIVEHVTVGATDASTPRPEYEARDVDHRFGALFEVAGSDWTLDADDVPAERDGETLVLYPDAEGDRTFVVERADADEGFPLVAEAVAVHPPTKNAILALEREGVERVEVPTDGTEMRYVEEALVQPTPVTDDRTFRLGDVRFHVSEE